MSLRLIPGVSLFRPCDALETAVAWDCAVSNRKQPTCILLTRQGLPVLHDYAKLINANAAKGGYVLSPAAAGKKQKAVILATGSEVHLALAAQKALAGKKVYVSVVSMPSWDRFDAQSANYKKKVMPKGIPCVAVEAGVPLGWSKYTGSDDRVLGINTFGKSGKGKEVYEKFGFTVENLVKLVQKTK
jgi:transketolase